MVLYKKSLTMSFTFKPGISGAMSVVLLRGYLVELKNVKKLISHIFLFAF